MRTTRLTSAACLAASLALAGPAAGAPISDLFVFGDSLSDAGNAALAADADPTVTPKRVTPPFGGLVPDRPYAGSDRFSNGPVWVEQVAGALGVSPAPSLAGGPNYAFGGALAGPAPSPGAPPGLSDQVQSFLSGHGNVAPADAWYVLWAGGNDAREAATSADPNAVATAALQSIFGSVLALRGAGASNFIVPNLPDLGLTPEALAAGGSAAADATAFATAFNAGLTLALLPLAFDPSVNLVNLDTFSLLRDVVASPGSYGLSVVDQPCVSLAAVCANPEDYLFWDGIHPSAAGHAVLARALLQALPSIPEPSTLLLLVLPGALWLRRGSIAPA